ncbi:MAG: hypothetical protein SGPRY_003727 [Prymnesium sp.]
MPFRDCSCPCPIASSLSGIFSTGATQVRGLLRETILTGPRRMEVVLGGLRQSFGTLQREGAVTLKGDLPEVNCVIEVTKEFDVVIRFDFEGFVGGWAERMGLLRVGLPFNVEGEVPDSRPTP